MRKAPLFSLAQVNTGWTDHTRWMSIAALLGLILCLNAVMLNRFMPVHPPYLLDLLARLQTRDMQFCISVNAALMSSYLLVCWRFTAPFKRMTQLMQQTSGFLDTPLAITPSNATAILKEMVALSQRAQEQAMKRTALKCELETMRRILDQCTVRQQLLLHSASREMVFQYQAVLGYAHYLDQQIAEKTAASQLRYDFDDVCESGFNLKMVAGALELLHRPQLPPLAPVALPALLQQTMLALAPSLDRRVMQLTTAEVDESAMALSEPVILSHVVWMVLLGMVRYAAAESTLRLRCLYNRDRTQVLLSIVVSELAPGAMSPEERTAHMVRQMQPGSPHMFAETIRIHGNIQLAEMLLARLEAGISVVPLSAYACEVCLSLPVA